MGIISDTFEDNREYFWQIRQQVTSIDDWKKDSENKPVIIHCHLCEELFFDDLTLKNHIVSKHANQHAYIKANDVILQDIAYIEGKLNDLYVEVLGDKPVNVFLSINGICPGNFSVTKNTSLLPYLKNLVTGRIEISLVVDGRQHDFIIYCGTIPEFEHGKIDSDAFDLLFNRLDKGHEPSLEKFQHSHMAIPDNSLEKRYSSGFFSYALAFDLTRQGKSGKTHFEAALHDLRPFATPFAISAQRVLALRMNFFGMLKDCGFPSKFAIANFFFNIPERRFNLLSETGTVSANVDYGIFIDDYTMLYLDALSAYYAADWNVFDVYEKKLNDIFTLGTPINYDRNNHDKLLLLRARAAIKKKDKQSAKDYYYQLVTHPYFSTEAKEICDG